MRLAGLGVLPVLALAALPVLAQDEPTRAFDSAQMQVARYSTAVAAPAAQVADPLRALVRLSFPRQTIDTVGEAITHALQRSGWRLIDPWQLQPQAEHLLSLPLPDSQRTLGPYPVRTVLEILTGPVWQWHEDRVQRLAWFELRPEYRPAQQPALSDAAKQPALGQAETAVTHPVADSSLLAPGVVVPEPAPAPQHEPTLDAGPAAAQPADAFRFPPSGESSAGDLLDRAARAVRSRTTD